MGHAFGFARISDSPPAATQPSPPTGTQSVSGISGSVDTNELNGTLAQLKTFMGAAAAQPDVMGDGIRTTADGGAATCH